jgi:hypothetical protein
MLHRSFWSQSIAFHHLQGAGFRERERERGQLILSGDPLTVKYPNAVLLGIWLKLKLLYEVV